MAMRRFIQKLFSRRAETLTELLISVLVISLGLTMFATAVMASRRMIEIGTERVDTYYDGRNELEAEKEGNKTSATLVIEGADKSRVNIGTSAGTNAVGTYSVRVYKAGSDSEPIWRYGR